MEGTAAAGAGARARPGGPSMLLLCSLLLFSSGGGNSALTSSFAGEAFVATAPLGGRRCGGSPPSLHRLAARPHPAGMAISMKTTASGGGGGGGKEQEGEAPTPRPAPSFVSAALTESLGVQRVQKEVRADKKKGSLLGRAVRKVVNLLVVAPGEAVGSWVVGMTGGEAGASAVAAHKRSKTTKIVDAEEQALREATATRMPSPAPRAPSPQAPAPAPKPAASATSAFAPPSTPTTRPMVRSPSPANFNFGPAAGGTGRLDRLIQGFSERRPGDTLPSELASKGGIGRTGSSPSPEQDRYMQLMDSYARRHEDGDAPQAKRSGPGTRSPSPRKPIYRSQFAPEPMEQRGVAQQGKSLPRTEVSSKAPGKAPPAKAAESTTRLDELMNKYQERATKTGQDLKDKIVRKPADTSPVPPTPIQRGKASAAQSPKPPPRRADGTIRRRSVGSGTAPIPRRAQSPDVPDPQDWDDTSEVF